MTRRNERGAATVLVIGAIGVIVLVAWALAVVAGYLAALHQVRQAADLAALSGAQAAAQGEEGCPVAERFALANGARVDSCVQVGDSVEWAITVRLQADVRSPVPGLPRQVPAMASAGVRQ